MDSGFRRNDDFNKCHCLCNYDKDSSAGMTSVPKCVDGRNCDTVSCTRMTENLGLGCKAQNFRYLGVVFWRFVVAGLFVLFALAVEVSFFVPAADGFAFVVFALAFGQAQEDFDFAFAKIEAQGDE